MLDVHNDLAVRLLIPDEATPPCVCSLCLVWGGPSSSAPDSLLLKLKVEISNSSTSTAAPTCPSQLTATTELQNRPGVEGK